MKKYRYPGAPPFSVNDENLFYGREEDIGNFINFIKLEDLLVLHSRSGLGKSSMLNAGVIPRLIKKTNYHPFAVKFSSYTKDSTVNPIDVVTTVISGEKKPKNFLNHLVKDDNSLWYQLKSFQIEEKGKKDIMLIFDQFENLFSFSRKQYLEFARQVADVLNVAIPQEYRDALRQMKNIPDFISGEELKLLYQPFNVHVVIAIREDKMALLNRLKDSLPSILNKTFLLEPLNRIQAEDAILYPAYVKGDVYRSPIFDYDDDALDKILDYLTSKDKKKEIEIFKISDDEKEEIESNMLQIVCQHIEENIVLGKNVKLVTADDLGDIKAIIRNYYDDIISKLPAGEQRKARLLIEDGLIFEEDMRRLNLYEGQICKKYEISKETLQELVNKRLLNVSGDSSYELSHDTLVAPILRAKAKRVFEEEKEAKRIESERIEAERIEEERIKDEKLFAIKKQKAAQRRRRMRLTATIAAIIFLSLTGFLIYFVDQESKMAEKNAELMRNQRVQAILNDSIQQSNKILEQRENELDSTNRELQENAIELATKNKELEKTTRDLKKSKADLTVAVEDAQKAQNEAQDNFEIAENRFEELQKTIGKQLMEKANREAAEKNHNAAKIYALHALKVAEFLSPEDSTNAQKLSQKNGYPLKVWAPKYRQKIQFIEYSPGETQIATTGMGYETIILWNATTGEEINTLEGHSDEVTCFDFSPDSNFLASGSYEEIIIWNTKNGKKVQSFEVPSGNELIALQYSPANDFLVSLTYDYLYYFITFWSTDKYKGGKSLPGFTSKVNCFAFSNNGKMLAIAQKNNTIDIYDTKKQTKINSLGDQTGNVNCISFSLDDNLLATGANDNNIEIWDIESGRKLTTLEEHDADITSLQFGPNNLLASGDNESIIKLWKINKSQLIDRSIEYFYEDYASLESDKTNSFATLKNHTNRIVYINFLNRGRKLASLGLGERTVKVWDIVKEIKIDQDNYIDKSLDNYISEAEISFNLKMVGSNLVINSSNIDSLYDAASITYDYTEQAVLYQRILKQNPNELDALNGMAYASLNLSNNSKAIKYYLKYLEHMPNDYLSWNYLGNAYYRQKNWDSAIISYNKSIAIEPRYESSWMNKGSANFNKGSDELKDNHEEAFTIYEEAIANYKEATNINPYSWDIYNYIGNIYFKKEEFEEAKKNYLHETENNPSNTSAWYNLGKVSYELGDTTASIEYYLTALDYDPLYSKAYNKLALVFLESKDYENAFRTLINSLEVNSSDDISWSYLGIVALQGDANDAIKFFGKALELYPSYNQNANFNNWLGIAYFKIMKYDLAIKYYKQALEFTNKDATISNNIAKAYTHSGQTDKAMPFFNAAIEQSTSTNMDYIDFGVRGFSNLALNNRKKANEDFRNSEKLNPAYDKLYRSWACYYASNKQVSKAFENLYKANNLGYTDYTWIENEPSLANIKTDDRFEGLIEKMKKEKQKIENFQKEEFRKYELPAAGNDQFDEGNYEQSLINFEEAFKLYPEDEKIKAEYADLLYLMGEDYLANYDFQAAYDVYEKLWEVDAEFLGTFDWNSIGSDFYNSGYYKNAIELYLHSVAIDKEYKWAWGNLGSSYWGVLDTTNTIHAYKKSLEIDPNYTFSLNGFGLVYYDYKEYDKAIAYFKQAVDIDPAYKWSWQNMGNAYYDKGNIVKSIGPYKKAVEIDPGYSNPINRLVTIYSNYRNYDSAVFYQELQAVYYPNNAVNWGNLSWYYLFAEKYEEALQASIKGYDLDNTQNWILTNKGHALLLLERVEKAKTVYLKIKDVEYNGEQFKVVLLRDLDALEKEGISNEYFDEIRVFLNE